MIYYRSTENLSINVSGQENQPSMGSRAKTDITIIVNVTGEFEFYPASCFCSRIILSMYLSSLRSYSVIVCDRLNAKSKFNSTQFTPVPWEDIIASPDDVISVDGRYLAAIIEPASGIMKECDLFGDERFSFALCTLSRMDMYIINTHVLQKKAIDLGQPISNLSEAKQSDYPDYRAASFSFAFKASL